MKRAFGAFSIVIGALFTLAPMVPAAAGDVRVADSCARSDFESVVDDAGQVLRQLTQKHSPPFQAKLRALKDRRGWTHDQFVSEGMRFVRDDKITALEERSGQLLAKINGSGAEGAGSVDCTLLEALKSDMSALVSIQVEKWDYMFTTIDAELAK